jgi:hypothetical protein
LTFLCPSPKASRNGPIPAIGSTSNCECSKKLQKRDAKVPAEMPANRYSERTRRNTWLTRPLLINGIEIFCSKFIAEKNSYETEIPTLPTREKRAVLHSR